MSAACPVVCSQACAYSAVWEKTPLCQGLPERFAPLGGAGAAVGSVGAGRSTTGGAGVAGSVGDGPPALGGGVEDGEVPGSVSGAGPAVGVDSGPPGVGPVGAAVCGGGGGGLVEVPDGRIIHEHPQVQGAFLRKSHHRQRNNGGGHHLIAAAYCGSLPHWARPSPGPAGLTASGNTT